MSRDSLISFFDRPLWVLSSLKKMKETPKELVLTFQLPILVREYHTETASPSEAQMPAPSEIPFSY
jgi:hypothetical protein